MKTYAFIDASNLFYGGKKSLGWSIDQEKLVTYLKEKYQVTELYYFGGVEIHKFPFDYLQNETVPVKELEKYLSNLIKEKGDKMTEAEIILLNRHYRRVRFYLKLEKFGYKLILKPVKTYDDREGNPIRKANCDVDMTLMLATEKDNFDRAIILSGDGDFLPVMKYLKRCKKEVLVLARGRRTAKEIKQFVGSKFMDFEYLRERLKRTDEDLDQ
ncbi:MAG: NYN domain-containing protein [Minisyncoccia bacterium]